MIARQVQRSGLPLHYGSSATVSLTGARLNPGCARRRRLALVCQGGGQRGIFTAGILDTFIADGYFPFHLLLGASAGAQNLAAYVCGEHGYARQAILHYSTRKEFFDPLRFARGGHLIDLDWYFDALHREAPLKIDRAAKLLVQRQLLLCATRRDNLAATYLPFDAGGLRQSVKASSAIPLLYRGGVALDGVVYWDGGVADALPVRQAHLRSADCIVVIRTVPKAPGNSVPSRSGQPFRSHCGMISYRSALDFIAAPPDGVSVIELAPAVPLKSRLLASKPEALQQDYRTGLACGRAFLTELAGKL